MSFATEKVIPMNSGVVLGDVSIVSLGSVISDGAVGALGIWFPRLWTKRKPARSSDEWEVAMPREALEFQPYAGHRDPARARLKLMSMPPSKSLRRMPPCLFRLSWPLPGRAPCGRGLRRGRERMRPRAVYRSR